MSFNVVASQGGGGGHPTMVLQASRSGGSLTLGQSSHCGQLSGSHHSDTTTEPFSGGAAPPPGAPGGARGRASRAVSRAAEPSPEVRTLRTRLAGLQGAVGTMDHHRAAFDLKNKVSGLLLAVKKEDGDVSSHSSSAGDDARRSPTRRQRNGGHAVGGRGTKRVFGGQKMRVSLRTKLIDVDKVIPAEADAAAQFEKRIAESKRKWRQVSHTFGTVETALYSRGVKDGDDGDEDDGDDHPNDDSTNGGSMREVEGAGGLMRRKSMSQRAGIRGKARELWRGNPTDDHWDGDSTEEEDHDEETNVDGGPNQMSLRVREAVFGSDEAYHACMEAEKNKRREAARRLRERQRRTSIADGPLAATVRSTETFEKATTLWATEDDAGEMYAEFIGCVRSHSVDWKARFLPRLPAGGGGCSRQQVATTEASTTDRSSALPSGGGGKGDAVGCLAPLLPESRLQDAVAAARSAAAKPSLSKGPHLPDIDCSVISRLVVDLVDAVAKPNSVVCPAQSSAASRDRKMTTLPALPQATHQKYRCPHCNLRPVAADNQALLDTMHALAQDTSLSHTTMADSVSDHEGDAVAALNVDPNVYTGIVADGAGWGLIDAVAAKLPKEVVPTSLMDLDRVMWREVASWVIRREEQAVMAEGSVPPSGATAAQRAAAEQFESHFKQFLTCDSTWQRQQEVLQLTRDKELLKLKRAHDAQRRLYNSNLSTLRAIQLDCEASMVELAAMKRRGDVAELVSNHQQLIALERESETLTVALCEAEFTRRGVKKWLSKATWTADGLHDSANRLRELRGSLLSLVNDCRDALTSLQAIQLRESDVAKPIDDTDAARTIYGRCRVEEPEPEDASKHKDSDPSAGSRSTGKGNNSISRLRAFVSSKLQPRKVDFTTIKVAVEKAQRVDFATDDALADVDEVLLSAKADAAWRHRQDGNASVANLCASKSQSIFEPEGNEDHGPVVVESIRRLLGARCRHCDHYLGSSKYCYQTGGLHASYASRARKRHDASSTAPPPGGTLTSEAHCGTAYRLKCVNSDLVCNIRCVLRSNGAPEEAPGGDAQEEDTSSASRSQAGLDWSSIRDDSVLASADGVLAAAAPSATKADRHSRRSTNAARQSTVSYTERKQKKAVASAARRRSSVMLARMKDRAWQDEVQVDSSDSDSEVEYAELDHDSEEDDVQVRRQSIAAMLHDGGTTKDVKGSGFFARGLQAHRPSEGGARTPKRGSLALFQFGEALPNEPVEEPVVAVGEGSNADDAVLASLVTWRRQSAVKERMTKRRKLKDITLRLKQTSKQATGLATVAMMVHDGIGGALPQDGDSGGSVDMTSKRFTDMATVNLLSIFNHELKWRMMAPLGEGMQQPPMTMLVQSAAGVRSPTFPSSEFSFGTQLDGDSTEAPTDEGNAPNDGNALLRKYTKSVAAARLYDTIKPPTTSISTAPGSAAASLATAAGTAAVSGGTCYQLWYPTNHEWRSALQAVENDWLRRISPHVVALSETMQHRANKLRGLALGRQRRPFNYHDLPTTPTTQQDAQAPPATRPPKRVVEPSAKTGGAATTVSDQTLTKAKASSNKSQTKKPVVIPTASASGGDNAGGSGGGGTVKLAGAVSSPRRQPAPVPTPPRASTNVKQKHPLTEGQLAFQIDRLKGVMELAYLPAKQILVRLQQLERQLDELNRLQRPTQPK